MNSNESRDSRTQYALRQPDGSIWGLDMRPCYDLAEITAAAMARRGQLRAEFGVEYNVEIVRRTIVKTYAETDWEEVPDAEAVDV